MSETNDVSNYIAPEVPNSFDDVTPEWCEWALRKGGTISETITVTEAVVERFKDEETGEINDGGGLTGAKLMRINLKYGGDVTGKEPKSVVGMVMFECKDTTSMFWRILLKLAGSWDLTSEDFWRTDIKFYRNILPIIKEKYKAPEVFYTGIIDKGNRNYLTSTILNKPCRVKTISLMEDLKDWGTLSLQKLVTTEALKFDDCAECLKNVAVLHATFWGNNHSDIRQMFQRLSFMESTFRPQAHSKMVFKKRKKFISSSESMQKGFKTMCDRWGGESYMSINKENTKMIPEWFTAQPLEDGSFPILKDPLVLEMLQVMSERFPEFAKSVLDKYLETPMQTVCHGDLQSGNHMFGTGKNNGKIVALDFQCVGMGMAATEVTAFTQSHMPSKFFMDLMKIYHTELLQNGVNDYPWEDFQKQCVMDVVENVMKTSMDFSEYTIKKFEQMFKIFGDKVEGFKKFLEGGVCGVGFILATDLYLKDKENFLNPEKFTINI